MTISFLIAAIVLHAVRFVLSGNDIQVGTVLFTHKDLSKRCWSEKDKALLQARFIMQDVLPNPNCIDFSESNVVEALLEYFHTCYDIISKSTCGKAHNLMCQALSDAVGGYLRAYALPLTKASYYSGKIKYQDARRLFSLYDDIRTFLKTDGSGWSPPRVSSCLRFNVTPFTISSEKKKKACSKLFLIESRKNEKKESQEEYEKKEECVNHEKHQKEEECKKKGKCEKDKERKNGQGSFDRRFGNEFYDNKPAIPDFKDLIDYDYDTDTNDENEYPFSFFEQNVLKKDDYNKYQAPPLKKLKVYGESGRFFNVGKKDIPLCKSQIHIMPRARNGIIEFPRRKDYWRQNRKRARNRNVEKQHGKLQRDFRNVMKQMSKNYDRVGLNGFGGDYHNDEVLEKKTTNETKCEKTLRKRKCRGLRRKLKNISKKKEPASSNERFTIPLPVLEDSKKPHTIAVPFKSRPLRNIQTRSSAFVLQRYYIEVIKCITSKAKSKTNLKNFNYKFYSWLTSQVYPHLSDEEWYPAFGGIHRVAETIKAYGAQPTSLASDLSNNIGYIFPNGISMAVEDMNAEIKTREAPVLVDDVKDKNLHANIYLLASIVAFVVLCVLLFCFCLYRLAEKCTSQSEYCRGSTNPEQRFLDFQFFVKNVKKSQIETNCSPGESYELFHTDSKGNFTTPHKVYRVIKSDLCKQKKRNEDSEEKISHKRRGEGDACNLITKAIGSGNQTTSSVSFWPYSFSNIKLPEIRLTVKPSTNMKTGFFKEKVQNLWKSSSIESNKVTVRQTKELSRSTSFSEISPHSGPTSSKTSYSTRADTKISSTTSELYENDSGRQKPITPKSVTETDTTESESGEGSSTESDDSRN